MDEFARDSVFLYSLGRRCRRYRSVAMLYIFIGWRLIEMQLIDRDAGTVSQCH